MINANIGRGNTTPIQYEIEPVTEEKKEELEELTKEDEELIGMIGEVNQDNEEIKTIKEITEGNFDASKLDENEKKTETKDVVADIDPETGNMIGIRVASGLGLDSENDIYDDFLDNLPADDEYTKIDNITPEEINKALHKNKRNVKMKEPGFSFAEYEMIKALLKKVEDGGEVKYKDLPASLKFRADESISQYAGRIPNNRLNEVKNMIAAEVINQLHIEILQDKMEQVYIDLDTSIKNFAAKESKEINAMERKKHHRTFIDKFPEVAEKIKDEDPDKAELLLKISEGYKQSYTMEDMYKMYTTTGKLKIKRIDVDKIHRLINEFNRKYENSKFTIKDLSNMVPVLERWVNIRYTQMAIKGFVAVFCKYTANMNPDNVDEHTFMYYFIHNILSLDIYDTNDEVEKKYRDDLIATIEKFLDVITEKMHISA